MARTSRYQFAFAYVAKDNCDKIVFGNLSKVVSGDVLETMLKVLSPIGHRSFLERIEMLRRKNDYVVFNLEGFEEGFKLKKVMKICKC